MSAELLAAAKDMLRFGEHDGECANLDDGGACEKHVAASDLRRARLEAAVEAAEKAGEPS